MIILVLSLLCAWTETFETQNYFPPNDWIIVNEDALDAVWYRDVAEGHTGIHSATCYGDTAYNGLTFTNLDYLITPKVLPQSNDTLLTFWYRATSSAGCSLDVMVSTTSPPAMPSFNLLQTIYITETSWTQQSVSLSFYSGNPVYVAFRIRRIPTSEQFYIDDITLPNMTSQPTICNGRLRTKGPPSQKYLQVWGSHYGMGYAHGYLLGEEIMAMAIRYVVGTSGQMYTPIQWESIVLPYFRLKYFVPQKYEDEAQGMYDGTIAKGVDLFHPEMGRDITPEDILCVNAVDEMGCSGFSGWGQSTIADDTLQGGLVIARNGDGLPGPYASGTNENAIIAYSPDAPDEQEFVSISSAGQLGCHTAVNRNGVGLCNDFGNHHDTTSIPPSSLVPNGLSRRHAIEIIDPDSNGINDIYDIAYTIDHSTVRKARDIHLFSPYDAAHPIPAAILEINNVGDSLRFVSDNHLSPHPINSDWNIAVTNHERVLYPPISCWRYQRIADSLNHDFHLTTRRAINIIHSVNQGTNTLRSMVFRPNFVLEHPDWPFLGISYARRFHGAHTQDKIWYSWNELFEGMPGIEEVVSHQIKRYHRGATIFRGPLQLPEGKKCKVFDITGRVVAPTNITRGIYFIEIDGVVTQKVVKVR
ncbi:MAG: choice-of-anchor J domain-containing protein [Desulfobacteraceae bacterium]|nr:choice-of-anchor J domain-containing protein [Desulfobacteraceae bacterium]